MKTLLRIGLALVTAYSLTMCVLYHCIPQFKSEISQNTQIHPGNGMAPAVTVDPYKLNWHENDGIFFKKLHAIKVGQTNNRKKSVGANLCPNQIPRAGFYSSGHFQRVNEFVSVYSAHIDNRTSVPYVRIITAAMRNINGRVKLWCHFRLEQDRNSSYVASRASLYEMCENHNRAFGGWIMSCKIPDTLKHTPCFFSLGSDAIFENSSTNSTVIPISGMYPLQGKLARRLNFGVCVPPLYGQVTPQRVMEFIELHRIMGVDTFIFYTEDVSKSVQAVLNYYSSKSVVSVIPWKIPFKGLDIWNHGQSLAINDCLYRHMNQFRFLAFLDIDEFLVPHGIHKNWKDVIQFQDRDSNHSSSAVSGYSFKSAYFDPYLNKHARANDLAPLVGTKRTQHFSQKRNKVLVRPSRVFELGIHHISSPWPDYKRYMTTFVEPEVAYIHHYRTCVSESGVVCSIGTDDNTVLLKYGQQFKANFTKTFKSMPLKI